MSSYQNSADSAKKITATFELNGRTFENVPVVNPGDWFGKCWHLEIAFGLDGRSYVVEAGSAEDAIDELIDSDMGDALLIDSDHFEDYAIGTDSPTCYFAGNEGRPVDLTWLSINGPVDCTYHVPDWRKPVKSTDLSTVREKLDQRESYANDVKEPGKFEGEAAFVPYFWDAYLNGSADDEIGDTLVFRVTDEDRDLFPELDGVDTVYLESTNDGFVVQVDAPAEPEESDDDAIEHVDLTSEQLQLASNWHSGQSDMLYAVSSSGGLYLGEKAPWNDDADRPMTDREWYVHLWDCLSCDVMQAARLAEKSQHEDAAALREFETFCDETAAALRKEYGLED